MPRLGWLRATLVPLLAAAAFCAQAADVRRLPYPFGQAITISSDADFQAPWHGRALHRFMNEELGLPISDSLWASNSSGAPDVSAFFQSFQNLNVEPSRVDGHPIFGLLLREWHRGNIDHLHSWSDDILPQYRYLLPEPLPLTATGERKAALRPAPWVAWFEANRAPGARGYQQLRLLFSRPPPVDLAVEAEFADGTVSLFPSQLTSKYRTDGISEPDYPATVTLILNEAWPVGVAGSKRLPQAALSRLRVWAPSCGSACDVELLGIERDNFSRWSVLRQKSLLESLNIRPALMTSHGGYTYHPNFEGPGAHYARQFDAGQTDTDTMRSISPGLAGRPGTHGYYADILQELGVKSVTSIWNGHGSEFSPWSGLAPPIASIHQGFYAGSKTTVAFGGAEPIEKSLERMRAIDPAASGFDLAPYVCSVNLYCQNSDQGSTLGALIGLGRHLIKQGSKVEHHWYTHFGTARVDPTFTVSDEAPLPPSAMEALRDLASDYYDPTGQLPEQRRVWVAPSAVWSNYRIMREKVVEHLTVDEASSTVRIASFFDPVLKRRLPEVNSGSRDLHGITVYVPSARKASLLLDGNPLTLFTRNRADATGRESITIVDDNTPTTVFNRLSPETGGSVSVTGGSYAWRPGAPEEASPGHLRLTARAPVATVRMLPRDLKFWNTTHLSWAYRVLRQDNTAARGRLSLTFVTRNGARITLAEGTGDLPPAGAQTGAWLETHRDGDSWRQVTVAQHDLKWAIGADRRRVLPLALGQISAIEIGLVDAAPGDILEIGSLQALRPSANGVAPGGGLLVAGRVLGMAGQPEPSVQVSARLEDGTIRSATTDSFGYYVFDAIRRGSTVGLTALKLSGPCAPERGEMVEIRRNEAELDIHFARCR